MAEALAIRAALYHAISLRYTKICLRTDCQVLVRALSAGRRSSELHGVLADIVSVISSSAFSVCVVSFIPRESNRPADCLAKACLLSFAAGPSP